MMLGSLLKYPADSTLTLHSYIFWCLNNLKGARLCAFKLDIFSP